MSILRLDEILKNKKVSGKELAEKLGVTENAISLIRKEKRQPRFELLQQIAYVLDVDVKDLFHSTKGEGVHGFVEYKDTIYRIYSKADLEKLVDIIE